MGPPLEGGEAPKSPKTALLLPESVATGVLDGQAREHLRAAGYMERGEDGILIDGNGNRAAFTLSYGSKGLERHMTVVKQTFRRFGVDMELRLLEPGTAFRNGLERQFEMTIMSRTAGMFPSPQQYYGSVYKETKNNNNVWAFGSWHIAGCDVGR